MGKKVNSPRFSFKGWNAGEWLRGHWKTIKETAKPLIPFYLSWVAGLGPTWSVIIAAVATGVISGLEYYVKEYK